MFKYIRIHDGFVLVSQFLLRLTIFKANGLYQHSFLSIVKDEHTQTQRTGVCGWVVGLLLSTPTPGHAGNSCLAFKGISWQWNLVARAGISRIRPQIYVDTRENKTVCGDNKLGVAEQAGTGILRAGDPTLARSGLAADKQFQGFPLVTALEAAWGTPYCPKVCLCRGMLKLIQISAVPACQVEGVENIFRVHKIYRQAVSEGMKLFRKLDRVVKQFGQKSKFKEV